MLALHTIWRFCLFRTCGVREYLSGLRAETPCVPPSLRGTRGFLYSCILGLKELDNSSVTLSLTCWCGNNAWAAAALCFGLEDRRGRHWLTPHNFCERHPAKRRDAFCYTRLLWFYDARIPCLDLGRRPPGDETACGLRKSPYSGNYRRYRTPPAYYERPKRRCT